MTRFNSNTTRGFAYLWMLFLVALIGLSLAAAVHLDATATQRSRERELLATGRQFRQAIARYHDTRFSANQPHEYPAKLEDLLQDPRSTPLRRYLRQIFVDPMTGKPDWGLVKLNGRIVGVHSLSEKTPIKQDNFEPEDALFRGKSSYAQWVFTYPADFVSAKQAWVDTTQD
jgi:type II secretory pathway pseudopilin PulG